MLNFAKVSLDMRYSKLFGKTEKEVPADASLTSHKLLHQAGYIRESVAGRYFLLPLAQRVQDKMVAIIKEEMDAAGAQQMLSPVLHPLELWEETNRNNEAGFELMKVEDRRGAAFALGGTAEEMFVDVVRKFQISYKDLPFNIYQFSLKFRDELRARGGLLRVREFLMKDAYSFHTNEEDFKEEYQKIWEAYERIFERCGLKTVVVEADNGYIGGDYCHEFVVVSDIGESRFLMTKDGEYAAHEDVAQFELKMVNSDEEVKEMEEVEQPEWVQSMDDNVKHYGKSKEYYLKNVVYRKNNGDLVIVTLRGDLSVNKCKLEQLLGLVGQLEDASDEDLKAIGTKNGYVNSWGHRFPEGDERKVIYVADESLKTVKNFIGGQKREAKDTINVNYGRDFKHEIEGDVAMAEAGFMTADGKELVEDRGVEVGNIFQLGHHYSEKMKGATFIDNDGKGKPFYMGCYGIGVGRTLATVVEVHHDEKGIVWPMSVAPFHVHLIALGKSEEVFERAGALYDQLWAAGIEVLYDDRNESAGKKFADADLIGVPLRLVLSERTLEMDSVEWKLRNEDEAAMIKLTDLQKKIEDLIVG